MAECFTDTTLDPVAIHSIGCVLAGHEHSEPSQTGIAVSQVEGEAIDAAPCALAQQSFEVGLRPQPTRGVQAEAFAVRG